MTNDRSTLCGMRGHGPAAGALSVGVGVAIAFAFAIAPSPAHAQSVEVTSTGAVTVKGSSEVHANKVVNAGTLTLTDGRLFIGKDLSNTGAVTGTAISVVEFNGSTNQSITSTSKLTLGKVRCNNAGSAGSDVVSLNPDLDCQKLDISDGTLRVFSLLARALSTDASESDPMVAVRAGAMLSLQPGATLKLGPGALIVFSSASARGELELAGTAAQGITIDADSAGLPYSLSVRGAFKGSFFSILHPGALGLEFKTAGGGALDPLIKQFRSGTFDFPQASGRLVDFAPANPMRIDTAATEIFKSCRFHNAASASNAKNVRTSATTTLQDAAGGALAFITFVNFSGSIGGEGFDDEPAGADQIRWQAQAPNPPACLDQFKQDAITQIAVGGTTAENAVVLAGTLTDPNGYQVKIEVESKLVAAAFDGSGTEVSGLVASGADAFARLFGVANGSYHWRARAVNEHGAVSGWISFGANAETLADFIVSNANNPPSAPTGLGQFQGDGTTAIAVGGTSPDGKVTFKGTVSDPASDQVKLQIEIKLVGVSFDGQSETFQTALLSSGSQGSILVADQGTGNYHWRARTLDALGHASAWVSFGGNPETGTDYNVTYSTAAPVITTQAKKTNDNTPIVQGTSQGNASIEVFANGMSIGTTTASGTGTWTFHNVSNPLADNIYSMTARATVAGITSGPSNAVSITVDTTPPPVPANVIAIPLDRAAVVTWSAVSATDLAGYNVWRKLASEPETAWVKLNPAGQVVVGTVFRDVGLTNGVAYQYRITSADDALNEAHP